MRGWSQSTKNTKTRRWFMMSHMHGWPHSCRAARSSRERWWWVEISHPQSHCETLRAVFTQMHRRTQWPKSTNQRGHRMMHSKFLAGPCFVQPVGCSGLQARVRPVGIFAHAVNLSLDWFVGENLNRKPMGFDHQIDRAFRLKFSHHPILWI